MRLELPNKIADELNTGKTRFNFILDPDRIIFQSYKLWPRTMPQTSFKTFSQGQPCF